MGAEHDNVGQSRAGREGRMRRYWKLLFALIVLAALLGVGHLASNRMLMAAVKASSTRAARLALLLGASPNAWDPNREQSPLHNASFNGDLPLVRLLLDHGAEVNARNACGQAPLHWAAEKGHVEVVRLLLAHGARTDLRDDDWHSTPLGFAVFNGPAPRNVEVVRLLLEHGASPNVDGDSPVGPPLEYAEMMGEQEIAALLRAHGAKHLTRPSASEPRLRGSEAQEHAAGD